MGLLLSVILTEHVRTRVSIPFGQARQEGVARSLRVACLESVQNGPVSLRVVQQVEGATRDNTNGREVEKRHQQPPECCLQVLVTADLPDSFMPGIVCAQEQLPIIGASCLLHLDVSRLKTIDVFRAGRQRGLLHGIRFQHAANCEDLLSVLERQLCNIGGRIPTLLYEAFHFQFNERFANGGETGAQLGRQVPLNEPLSLLKRSVEDGFSKCFGNAAPQAIAGQAREGWAGHPGDYMIEQWSATSRDLSAPCLTQFANAAYDRLIDHRAAERWSNPPLT